jgi:hypothetical protein
VVAVISESAVSAMASGEPRSTMWRFTSALEISRELTRYEASARFRFSIASSISAGFL